MNEYKAKWNNYEIGKVPWINSRLKHPAIKLFVDYVSKFITGDILEIGAGECIEALGIREYDPDIDYTIMDVSSVFLEYAKLLDFYTIESCMTDINVTQSYSLIYMNSVLEHTPDIRKTVKELARVSNSFFITMFKWRYTDKKNRGGLKSVYQTNKNYYSSEFNIYNLFDLFEEYGTIEEKIVSLSTGPYQPFDYYSKGKTGLNRNGDYLSFWGTWK